MTTTPPPLNLLRTLSSPSAHSPRAWHSLPHPSTNTPLLATASSDKSVHIWSLRDFRLLSTISGGHKRSIRCVGWKDYGHNKRRKDDNGEGYGVADECKRRKVTLATGSFDANVGIWEWNNPSSQTRMDVDADEPSERDLTHADQDGEEEEWNFSTLLTGPDSEIKSLAFSPPHYSANLLATSSRDKSVWVWEEVEDEEWETIAVCQEHEGDVKSVAWCEGANLRKRRKVSHPDGMLESGEEYRHEGANEEEEEVIVGSREVLASSSYDDTIRLYRDVEEEGDWMCIAVLNGHTGTVWDICWEKSISPALYPTPLYTPERLQAEWDPRLLSCSDDLSVRVWRRELSEAEKEKRQNHAANGETRQPKLPSIIRPPSNYEKWVPEAQLPEVHLRSVYAVDWSRRTGLVLSCGGDGVICVYQEVSLSEPSSKSAKDGEGIGVVAGEDIVMNNTPESLPPPPHQPPPHNQSQAPSTAKAQNTQDTRTPDGQQETRTTWMVVALMEAAHDEFEINHVCWAPRRDSGVRYEGEEVIVSTGDDGAVRLWILPEEVVRDVLGEEL